VHESSSSNQVGQRQVRLCMFGARDTSPAPALVVLTQAAAAVATAGAPAGENSSSTRLVKLWSNTVGATIWP
jgi:hypothetical protein